MATTAPRFGLAAGVLILATSCARPVAEPASRPQPSVPGATSPAPTTSMSPSQVPPELRFAAPRLGGGTIRGAAFAGHDLVMWFWAPW